MGGTGIFGSGKRFFNRQKQRAIARRSHRLHAATAVVIDRLEERRMFASGSTPYLDGDYSAQSVAAGADPVQLSNGLLILNTTDLQADGFGASWGVSRSWSNSNAFDHTKDFVGNGWDINQHPQLIQPTGSSGPIEVLTDASSALWFQGSSGSYNPWSNNQQSLAYNASSDLYTLTDLQGNQTTFYGFSNTSYSTFAGTFDSYQPASGSLISVTSHVGSGDPAAGAIQQEQRQQTIGGITTTETWNYNYSGGLLTNVTSAKPAAEHSPPFVRPSIPITAAVTPPVDPAT